MPTVLQKLSERHLNPSLYQMHINEEDGVATFYLFNLTGKIVGYHTYRWYADKTTHNNPKESRYYTHVSRPSASKDPELSVWGLETFNFRKDVLFLTEGVFDAVRLHNLGLPAVAVLANNPKRIKSWLSSINRYTVAVCDGDKAGKMLAKTSKEAVFLSNGKDLGDMTDNEVYNTMKKWL